MTLNRIFVRKLARSAGNFTVDYCKRHKHPVNAALHIVGVPAVVYGLYQLAAGRGARFKALGASMIVFGYILQFLGHRSQGNEVGEVSLIKMLIEKVRLASYKSLQTARENASASDQSHSSGNGSQREKVNHNGNGHKGEHNGNGAKSGGKYILWWKTSHS